MMTITGRLPHWLPVFAALSIGACASSEGTSAPEDGGQGSIIKDDGGSIDNPSDASSTELPMVDAGAITGFDAFVPTPPDAHMPSLADASACRDIRPTSYLPVPPTECVDAGMLTYADNPWVPRADADSAYASMPPVQYTPPANRFLYLPRTLSTLCCQSELSVVMLGDSIINNTSHSRWEEYLNEALGTKVRKVTAVRGSTGSLFYAKPPNLYCAALSRKPDLLILGGISEIYIDSLRAMIEQVRAISDAEILLLTPVFGTTDPADPSQWTFSVDPAGSTVRAQMIRLAEELHFGVFDIAANWGQYILDSGRPLSSFKVDNIHGNTQGEQLLGHLLTTHLNPRSGGSNLCSL